MTNSLSSTYFKDISKMIEEALDFFPCLEKAFHSSDLTYDNQIKITYALKGLLVTRDELDKYHLTAEDAKTYFRDSFVIYCVIPVDFLKHGCKIYDSNNVINWQKLPYEHRHISQSASKNLGVLLCTHLPDEVKDMNNPILENLKTAYALYKAYKHYLKTSQWLLDEYKHGNEGKEQYYETRRYRNRSK